ncbi:MAG: glycosyltransferase [Desulfurococcaceae archaeon]|nr:glycosyltransferase [Desulfurococcaceae archaeon]
MRILAYTYYNSPWDMQSGDDVRTHTILTQLAKSYKVVAVNLSVLVDSYYVHRRDGVTYVTASRKFYNLISSLVRWSNHYDLNPLVKLTHYMDEFIAALKFINLLRNTGTVLVFGSMTLFSFMLRVLGVKNATVVYDPLANYAQTLHLRSRKSFIELLRYGLYLALHKLQLKSSDIVVYPSHVDLENARRMFRVVKAVVVPNPTPVCYNSIEEYLELRRKRVDHGRPYFILLAGGRGRANEEAVKLTVEVFNKLPPEKFKLLITGPWQDVGKRVKNPSIELLGVVPREKLKELLAVSDYGLSPVFSHSAGTFIKVLAYLSAGLRVIASPHSVMGLDSVYYPRVYVVRNREEFSGKIREVVESHRPVGNGRPQIKLCSELYRDMKSLSQSLPDPRRLLEGVGPR